MSIHFMDRVALLAARVAYDSPNGTRAAGIAGAVVDRFAGNDVTVKVYSASGLLLATLTFPPWAVQATAVSYQLQIGTPVAQTRHATGIPYRVHFCTSTGDAIISALVGGTTNTVQFVSDVHVDVPINCSGLAVSVADGFDTIPPPDPGGRTTMVTPAMLANLAAHKLANTEQYVRAVGQADTTPLTGNDVFWNISTVALVYRATENPTYLATARTMFAYITAVPTSTFLTNPTSSDVRDLKQDSGFYIGSKVTPVAYAFDLLYDELSTSERRTISEWIMDWADFTVYDASSEAMMAVRPPYMTSVYGRHPYTTYRGAATNNYYWKYARIMAGVLVAHDDAREGLGGYAGQRRQWHLVDFASRWAAQVEPIFTDTTDTGPGMGGFKESSSYDSVGAMLSVLASFAAAGYTEYSDLAFVQAIPAWRVSIWMPGATRRANYGDQASSAKDARVYADRHKATLAQGVVGIAPAVRRMLHRWLQTYPTTSLSFGSAMVTELLELPATYDAASDYADANRALFSGGGCIWLYRNSFTDANTTALVWTGGAPLEGHMYKAGGGVLVWKGNGYVLGNANLYSYSGIRSDSLYHNVVCLVSGTAYCGQNFASVKPVYQQIFNAAVPGDYLATGVNSAPAYQYGSFSGGTPYGYVTAPYNGVSYLSDNTRKLIYVTDIETMFVLDRVSLNPGKPVAYDRLYQWWGTRTTPPTVSGLDFDLTADSTTHHTLGRVVSGGIPEVATEQLALLPVNQILPAYCIRTRRSGSTSVPDRVLTGMQFVANAVASVPHSWGPEIVSVAGSPYRGFSAGAVCVMFGDTDVPASTTAYETAATTHYVTDCIAGRAYSIRQQPTGGGVAEATISVTATTAGILKFTSSNIAARRFVLE